MGTIMLNGIAYGGGGNDKFMRIVDRVDTVDDLPVTANEGDVYLVGLETEEDCEEYVYTTQKGWEHIGNTAIDLSGYVKKTDMPSTMAEYGIKNKDDISALKSQVNENQVTLGYSKGYNLFEKRIPNSYVETNGKITADVDGKNSNDVWIAKVTEGKTYTLSNTKITAEANNIVSFFRSIPSVGSTAIDNTCTVFLSDTLTIPTSKEIKYIAVKTPYNGIPQIEEGTTATPYEPYKPSVDERLAKTISTVVLNTDSKGEIQTETIENLSPGTYIIISHASLNPFPEGRYNPVAYLTNIQVNNLDSSRPVTLSYVPMTVNSDNNSTFSMSITGTEYQNTLTIQFDQKLWHSLFYIRIK